ncbi:hydantoinase/oxoprolinase family protein [Persephonella sp.]
MVLVGVDTGGTFTDIVYIQNGKISVLKVPSTPENPAKAVLEGLSSLNFDEERYIVHGSTVATNAVLERKGVKTAFITNSGFEDIIFIGRQNRKRLYDLKYRRSQPFVPEDLRFGLDCRVDYKGEILKDLELKDVEELIEILDSKDVESVAVSFLFSFLNSEHEKTIKDMLSKKFFVSISSEILPEFREFERSSTVVLNAYVAPIMDKYIMYLQNNLSVRDNLLIMQSNGGSISPETAKKEAVRTILSGPAGGVIGAYRIGETAGFKKIITYDMGGTSTDVSLIDENIPFTTEYEISDYPIKIPVIDIYTVGAGGGSIAYIDSGGSLNVGPESAGADPGPVSYGKGTKITVTDANVFLRRLMPEYFLGGKMRLYPERVEKYLSELSDEMGGIDLYELAEGILTVANTKMEQAIRKISVEKGFNPEEFVLFTYGGAGGLHAPFIAKEMSIKKVVVPLNPGVLSAMGMLMSDIIKDYSLTVMIQYDPKMLPHIDNLLEDLKEKGIYELKNEGFVGEDVKYEYYLDMRYKGQSFELIVPYINGEDVKDKFYRLHKRIYGYYRDDVEIEIVNIRVRIIGVVQKPKLNKIPQGNLKPDDALLGEKEIYLDGSFKKVKVYDRSKLKANNIIKSPALIIEYSSTTVIPEFSVAEIDQFGNIVISIED